MLPQGATPPAFRVPACCPGRLPTPGPGFPWRGRELIQPSSPPAGAGRSSSAEFPGEPGEGFPCLQLLQQRFRGLPDLGFFPVQGGQGRCAWFSADQEGWRLVPGSVIGFRVFVGPSAAWVPIELFRLFEPRHYLFLRCVHSIQFLAIQGFRVLFRVSVKTGPDLFHGACRFRVAVGSWRSLTLVFQARRREENDQVIPGPRGARSPGCRFMEVSLIPPSISSTREAGAAFFSSVILQGKLVGGDGFPVLPAIRRSCLWQPQQLAVSGTRPSCRPESRARQTSLPPDRAGSHKPEREFSSGRHGRRRRAKSLVSAAGVCQAGGFRRKEVAESLLFNALHVGFFRETMPCWSFCQMASSMNCMPMALPPTMTSGIFAWRLHG